MSRKILKLILGCAICILCIALYEKDEEAYAAGTYTVYRDKTSAYKGKKSALKLVGKVSSYKMSEKGTYPTRKGVILVTSTGKIANVVGHTAIVYSSGYIVESVEQGVVVARNNWKTRKKHIAAVTVRDTTVAQDSKVSEWCRKQKGKEYNYNYYNINNSKAYYCSQLIWAGYKRLFNINLNTKAYDVGAKKAIGPYELVSKSSSKVYPIYMKNWNR